MFSNFRKSTTVILKIVLNVKYEYYFTSITNTIFKLFLLFFVIKIHEAKRNRRTGVTN